MSVLSVVCCQVEVSATVSSLVRRSPTKCGVSEGDLEKSMMGPRSTSVVESWGKKLHENKILFLIVIYQGKDKGRLLTRLSSTESEYR